MKKEFALYATVALLIIGACSIFFMTVLEDAGTVSKTEKVIEPVPSGIDYSQSERIGGVKENVQLSNGMTEGELLKLMHQMTHQKVEASEKWGAVPMNAENIAKVHKIVSEKNFHHKERLLEIANRWKLGNFNEVDLDHNEIWFLQGGSVGKATGILSQEQEERFIANNFSEAELNVYRQQLEMEEVE